MSKKTCREAWVELKLDIRLAASAWFAQMALNFTPETDVETMVAGHNLLVAMIRDDMGKGRARAWGIEGEPSYIRLTSDPAPQADTNVRKAAWSLINDLDRSLVGSRDVAVIHATNTSVKRLRILLEKLDREAPSPVPDVLRYRHRKGGAYEVLGIGKMQSEMWEERGEGTIDRPSPVEPVDMREVVVYRSEKDRSLWVRPREEFEDGRFTILAATDGSADD